MYKIHNHMSNAHNFANGQTAFRQIWGCFFLVHDSDENRSNEKANSSVLSVSTFSKLLARQGLGVDWLIFDQSKPFSLSG